MHKYLSSTVKYRKDINGLRAWAVIAVLLFHFSLIRLPGGFVGVDIFFVISGYLMTAIIVGGYEKGSFSIWKFYMSRIRRILPVLLVLISLLLIFGWFFLPTIEYKTLGSQSTYAIAFISNIHFWLSSGYFNSASHEKWLLHTWSLAVEAQFYILYPIFLTLIWKFFKSIKAMSIIFLFIVSLILNLYVSPRMPDASFYLLPTRAWELTAGGLVFLAIKNNLFSNNFKNIGYWFGWILIIGSFFFISEKLTWPSYWAILPVLGTSLVMLDNQDNVLFTNNYLAQWLGDRSYSLYLWHWPIVVALYFIGLHTNLYWVLGGVTLSIVLSQLSYKFIEIPTRQYLTNSNLRKELIVMLSFAILIGILAISIKLYKFDNRVSKEVETVANQSEEKYFLKEKNPDYIPSSGIKIGKSDNIKVILLGDSHAETVISALEKSVNGGIEVYLSPGCGTVLGMRRRDLPKEKTCENFNKNSINKINTLAKNIPIIIVNRDTFYLQGYQPNEPLFNSRPGPGGIFNFDSTEYDYTSFHDEYSKKMLETICSLSSYRKVFLVRPYPEMTVNVPKYMTRTLMISNKIQEPRISLLEYHRRNAIAWKIQDKVAQECAVKILNPLPYLCDDKYCYGSKNGMPLYYDDDHLSEYGNKLLVPMFEEVFNNKGDN